MVTGKTKTGFSFAFEKSKVNDMRVIRALGRVDKGDPEALDYVGRRVLGEDLYDKLLKHIETEDGRQPVDALVAEINDIFSASNDGKK